MGNFYVNVTLKGPGRDRIAAWLAEAGFDAYLSQTVGGLTTVCEAGCDSQDDDHIRAFAAKLSEQLGCPALAVLNHDDDLLWYGLYAAGVLDHEYNSAPDFFEGECLGLDDDLDLDDDGVSIPEGGDAQALCAAFGPAADPAEVEAILRALDDETGYVFAFERHEALAKALGLPDFTVCCGYRDLERGCFPRGYGEADFLRCAAG
ncbi:MAG: hypothetical protein QNJ30_01090 [Kiloniellales bacterium]|nr:hypothetical protein [Kiloniellales bacterium]